MASAKKLTSFFRSGLVDLPHLTAVTYFSDPSNQLVVAGTMKVGAHLRHVRID